MADCKQKKPGRPKESDSTRKRKVVNRNRETNLKRITLGSEIDRWNEHREDRKHSDFATILLDMYVSSRRTVLRSSAVSQASTPRPSTGTLKTTSTPGPSTFVKTSTPGPSTLMPRLKTPPVSDISALDSGSEVHMSGVEAIAVTDTEVGSTTTRDLGKQQVTRTGRIAESKALSTSFVDPFDLTMDVSEEYEENNSDDPNYEPSFQFTEVLSEDVHSNIEEVGYEDVIFGMEREADDVMEEDDVDEVKGHGVKKITSEDECEGLSRAVLCLSFVDQIKTLATTTIQSCTTPECKRRVGISEEFVGSAMYLKWICEAGHLSHRWCSQPILNKRLHSGDFLCAATILSSGNNFGKMALWAQMLNLKFMSASSFYRIQSHYLVPTIDSMWEDHQTETLDSFRDKDIIILGDGRNDSPGHSAQYCTYTFMEDETKRILTLHTLDKRVTDRKSANLEKVAFNNAMTELNTKGIIVKEVVTDAHLGIGALMKNTYPNIKHSNDIWHVAKNLGKKIMKVAQQKDNNVLMKWSRDIVNHFWFCCKEANTYLEFLSLWHGVLHHITNQHEWILSHGDGLNKCLHEPLSEEDRDKPWLSPTLDVTPLKALTNVILDKRLLNRVGYFLNFRSTAELEVFHQHLLMYCSKRFAYSPPVYRVRNKLAALDHNKNLDCPIMKNKQGNPIYHRCYNKKSGRWSVFPVKTKKSYIHIRDLVKKALWMRIQDKRGMKRKREMEEDDPRRIAKHLAPTEPPSTQELVEKKQSRFDKK